MKKACASSATTKRWTEYLGRYFMPEDGKCVVYLSAESTRLLLLANVFVMHPFQSFFLSVSNGKRCLMILKERPKELQLARREEDVCN